MSQSKKWRVIKGILLGNFANTIALSLILLLILYIHFQSGGYAYFVLGFVGVGGFFIWQLLYLIPLCIWLKQKGKLLMMKGVIIAAVITALTIGGYVLYLFFR